MLDFGFYNMDCMDGMREFPDNYFDLAIVDPPYGISADKGAKKRGGHRYAQAATESKIYHVGDWDSAPPDDEYFNELFRVSKNQIIWGGNYYKQLPPSKGFICWDKRTENISNSYADVEYAWMSNNLGVARMFRFLWSGMLQENMGNKENRIHPTQKPVALYKWILTNYAKPGDKILDTHVGSASSLIACYDLGFDYVGFEIDEGYYRMASERLADEMAQIRFNLDL